MAARLDALTVRETEGKSYWTRIGVAFPNREGPGFMVKLDAMPASKDGQYIIHLREPRENNSQGGGQRRQAATADDDYVPGF
jgi:hypothetical protein